MDYLWRTAAAVKDAATSCETSASGGENLLKRFGLGGVSEMAAKARHINFALEEHAKQFDPISKLSCPDAYKQLYSSELGRWDLLPVASWPSHSYPWQPIPPNQFSTLQLQPGLASLPDALRGQPVGPLRVTPRARTPTPPPDAKPRASPTPTAATGEGSTRSGSQGRASGRGSGRKATPTPQAGGAGRGTGGPQGSQEQQASGARRRKRRGSPDATVTTWGSAVTEDGAGGSSRGAASDTATQGSKRQRTTPGLA
ncbi:hypothetical protein V8C86DRAFT_2673717 [Haematococcus lacustris]